MRRTLPPVLLAEPTRFAGLARRHALAGVAATLALVLAVLVLAIDVAGIRQGSGSQAFSDLQIFNGVVEAVRHGQAYYPTTADALRATHLPLSPMTAFRLPALAVIQAALPPVVSVALLWALTLAVLLAWDRRLRPVFPRTAGRFAVVLLLVGGTAACWQAGMTAYHDVWAGLFVALSLAMRTPGRWIEAVAFGLAAMLIRETAALYVVVMAALAMHDARGREATGWLVALGVFAIVLVFHAYAIGAVLRPFDSMAATDPALLGLGGVVDALSAGTMLAVLPLGIAAPLVALSLIGWLGWRDPLAVRISVTLAGYAILFSILARPDQGYWALLIAPASLLGLAFVPDALRDLVAAALDKRRITVRRVVR